MFANPTPASRPRPAIGRVVVTWLLSPRISLPFPPNDVATGYFPNKQESAVRGPECFDVNTLPGDHELHCWELYFECIYLETRIEVNFCTLHIWIAYLSIIFEPHVLNDRTNENFHVSMSYSELHLTITFEYPVSEFNEKHHILWMILNDSIELLYWIIE